MNIQRMEWRGLVEAFIFSQTDPVSEKLIYELLEKNSFVSENDEDAKVKIHDFLVQLQQEYETKGIRLHQVGGGWQFRTAEEWAPYLVKVITRPKRLSRATMETLAIVAYHQPCTRADIERIRGVGLSQTVLDSLLENNLIKPCGHKQIPGRPTLWGTTKEFLAYLGLSDLSDLPKKEDLFGDIPYQDSSLS